MPLDVIDNDIYFDPLKMYFGDDFVINDKIIVKCPTIGEVAEYGEIPYMAMAHTIVAIPSDMKAPLDDIGLDWNEISDFQLFSMLCQGLRVEQTSILFGDLDFSKLKVYPHPQIEDMIVLANKESGVLIDEYIYTQMVAYIRKMHGFAKTVEHAKNKITKKVLIEEERAKLKQNTKKKPESYLLPLISSVKARMGYTNDYVRQMKLTEFFDLVQRLNIIRSSDALLNGMYSGFMDTSKLNKNELNWMREITYDNNSGGIVINEANQNIGTQ